MLFLAWRVLRVDGSVLRDPQIQDRVGFLYEGLDLRFMQKRSFVIVYILRRVLMAAMFGLLQAYSGIALQLCLQINLFMLIYIGESRPYLAAFQNAKELANEVFVLTCTQAMILFSDYCSDDEFQYFYGGRLYIGLVAACLLFNLFFVLRVPFRRLRLHAVLAFKKFKRFLTKFESHDAKVTAEAVRVDLLEVPDEQKPEPREASQRAVDILNLGHGHRLKEPQVIVEDVYEFSFAKPDVDCRLVEVNTNKESPPSCQDEEESVPRGSRRKQRPKPHRSGILAPPPKIW